MTDNLCDPAMPLGCMSFIATLAFAFFFTTTTTTTTRDYSRTNNYYYYS